MIDEAKRYSAEDRQRRQEAEARNNADSVCYNAAHQLDGMGESADKENARAAVNELRRLLDEKAPIPQIEEKVRELEAIMQSLGNAGTGGGHGESAEAEVIDAEFDEN
jgi:molecular chaperone DnaK